LAPRDARQGLPAGAAHEAGGGGGVHLSVRDAHGFDPRIAGLDPLGRSGADAEEPVLAPGEHGPGDGGERAYGMGAEPLETRRAPRRSEQAFARADEQLAPFGFVEAADVQRAVSRSRFLPRVAGAPEESSPL